MMAMYLNAHGQRCKPSDFMPNAPREKSDGMDTYNALRKVAKSGKSKG
jgi:hypothetical protein